MSSIRKSSTCHPGSMFIRYSEMLLWPCILVTASASSFGAAERRIPVRRNLLCFMVSAEALWIGRSQSLHKMARSSWQKRKPVFCCGVPSPTGGLASTPIARSRCEATTNLANIAEWRGLGGRRGMEEGEATVLAGKPVGAVDAAVAAVAERSFVGAAEHRRGLRSADLALHLHIFFFCSSCGGGRGGSTETIPKGGDRVACDVERKEREYIKPSLENEVRRERF
ncbi:hypothetical protein MUK42_05552 [Musa troglodytarum]|uniref:Uncharacterized protein n=1 Tax=Musa troglodytarum TaxID=320322 RepID=A0A9E7EUG5_9LILI|nr:hypothetical protein MUK42_05552 [Musa troglodytarum]